MKNTMFILSIFCASFKINCQSFTSLISPSSLTLSQGTTVSNAFTINVLPTGGFNATVNYQLIVPPQLAGAVSINSTIVNNPYPSVYINVNKYFAPTGTHQIILKSFNGAYETYDTCALVISYNPCPDWFAFKSNNSPVPADYGVCTGLDRSQNFWMGSILAGPSLNQSALFCFDKNNNWYVWTPVDFKTYDAFGTITYSTASQKILDYGVYDICNLGDTVFAISAHNVYSVINKSISVIPGPVTNYEYSNLTVDINGDIWVGTQKNVYRFTGTTWNAVVNSTAPFSSNINISDFELDKNGNVWITNNGALYKFDGTFWTTYNSSGLGNVWKLAISKNGTLWLGGESSAIIYRYNSSNSTFTGFSFASYYNRVENIAFNASDDPVIASTGGVYIFNGTTFSGYNNTNSAVVNKIFTSTRPREVSMDSSGNIMVANEDAGFIYHCVNNLAMDSKEIDRTSARVALFPNPATSQFQLSGLDMQRDFQLIIYNLNGSSVYNSKHKGSDIINTELPSGLYIVGITDILTNKMFTTKLVISN